jgi:EAL domain-containing protein (putative c-di-GMP-specific phosphodiesterase class I)
VLLEIPANVVKIDKKITDRINSKDQRDFVSNMGKFISSAEEEVIFEGIETEEQSRFLTDNGFLYGQGYLFDRPIPVTEFESKYIV